MRDDFQDESWEDSSGPPIPHFVKDPIGAAQRRWLAMAVALGLGLLGTFFSVATWSPTYEATASVLITSQKIPDEFVQSTVPVDSLANINAMVGEIMSAEVLSGLIDTLGLFPGATDGPRIDLINTMRGRIEASPGTSYSRRHGRDSLVFEISYTSPDRVEAAAVANALAELFVEASIRRRNLQAQETTVFLKQELERDDAELREQSRLVAAFRREHRGELPEELQSNLRKVDMLSARRESNAMQISDRENRILTLMARGGDAPLSESEVLLGELRRELARESAVHTEVHPNVIALRERIARLEQSLSGDMSLSAGQQAVVNSERRAIAMLQEQNIKLELEIAELETRIDITPEVAERLDALLQKEKVLREDYLQSLRKVEAAELAENLESARQGAQVSVLDAAQVPTRPVQPRWLVGLMGLGIALTLALGIAVLLELVDPVVVGAAQIGEVSDRPVLGALPEVA